MKKARVTSKREETAEFLEFWQTWFPIKHNNDGRGSARDEFFRHVEVRGVDPQDIVDGVKWYVMKGDNWKCHATTWLNRCDYEDGCELYRAYQAKIAAVQAARSASPSNVVPMVQSEPPAPVERKSEAERTAHFEALRAKLRSNQ